MEASTYSIFLCLLVFLKVVASLENPKLEPKNVRIPDYVKNKGQKIEHQDHTHPNPLKSPAADPRVKPSQPYTFDAYEQEEDNLHGEAAKYRTPSNPTEVVVQPIRRVEDTKVDCQKSHMFVTFKFSAPFNGVIYPHDQFMNCILFSGQNSNEITLTLYHGPCGQKHLENANVPDFTAVIEHRLMIQWERDFVCEDDSSVIVRCDRPDDFNKTVAWNFQTLELGSTLERNTHPGPKMWMQIQRGEGPNAPPLDDKPTFIGDVLTIVFTLSDDVFWFGSNILSCVAVDGGESEKVKETSPYATAERLFSGRMNVIENECSTKPKIFSHIMKERITKDGNLVTLHYAHFKAFRFPTSQKVVLQCDVQVCYKKCDSLPPCSVGFQPRAATAKDRQRRETSRINRSQGLYEEGTELDTVLLYRTIEVFSAEDGALREVPVKVASTAPKELFQRADEICYKSQTFYSWIAVFALTTVFLLAILIWNFLRSNNADARKLFSSDEK